MLFQTLAAVLVFASTALAQQDFSARTRCWSGGNGQPARWWSDGETIMRGKYWYVCERGRLAPRGCVTETNRKLNIGNTIEAGGYVAICELGT
ncbi:hypothetical protein ANCDUO_04728 [Ancylostoma duodenale]|uniref:Abnormal cell migration protein 18-like fibronectin type I domain-containing protein n=1 Tax=Ancylostoma duodenale TaxID=51022 RepID=A0A0C2GUB2_9BILA|nr:hypothetical protein ANCDUO_04728 [Ancylostoma duodenale]